MYVGQVDGAGSEVDDCHGDALSRQSGKLVEVHSAELEVVDEVVWFRTAQGEGEVLLIEGRDLLLQRGQRNKRDTHVSGKKYLGSILLIREHEKANIDTAVCS